MGSAGLRGRGIPRKVNSHVAPSRQIESRVFSLECEKFETNRRCKITPGKRASRLSMTVE